MSPTCLGFVIKSFAPKFRICNFTISSCLKEKKNNISANYQHGNSCVTISELTAIN